MLRILAGTFACLFFPMISFAGSKDLAQAPVTTLVIGASGAVLANGTALTLYTFDPDGTGTPTCVGKCAEIWPPALVNAIEEAALVAPLGAVARPDGMKQLTADGRPVYTFSQDSVAGDRKGQGLGGVWFAVDIQLENQCQ